MGSIWAYNGLIYGLLGGTCVEWALDGPKYGLLDGSL